MNTKQGFIIIQIGNPQLDLVCEKAIVPALRTCGLDPRRVDKHNQGGLLKSEIISFIENSEILIADLTNERPNCYLEVGYAMGVGRFRNLILTAREDHNADSQSYRAGGSKIHFDLSGYDVLFWNPERLDEFRVELIKRIQRRQAILSPPPSETTVTPSAKTVFSDAPTSLLSNAVFTVPEISPWDDAWLSQHRVTALKGLKGTNLSGFMEVCFALSSEKPNKTQSQLLKAAEQSQIETFGWPIGVVLSNREEFRPRPRVDGIVAEVAVGSRESYDYWALKRDGDFYLLQSLFEDTRKPGSIFFNTRIVRVTEVLLYCARLYSNLGVPSTASVNIFIRHGGLKGRFLRSTGNRLMPREYTTTENEVDSTIREPLVKIETNLVDLVKKLTEPLFMIFDYFEVLESVYAEIVNSFVADKVI